MTVFLLCFLLFLVGLYGVLTKRNAIKVVISLTIMEISIFLFLALIGYVDLGDAPIIVKGKAQVVFVDPLPQAMVLTAIVIGLATNAMLLAMAIRLYRKYGTFDVRKMNNLNG